MAYIGKGISTREVYNYTATSNQTAFTGSDINSKTLSFDNTPSLISVFLNGVQLKLTTDYNLDTSNTVTLTSGASASDELMVEVYSKMSFTDAMPKTGGTFSGALSGVDVNGTELILDADGDTSITADTDDQIDFKAGNIIRASVISTGLQVGGTAYFASPTLTLKDPDSGVGSGTVGGKIDFHTSDSTASGVSATIKAKYEDANGNTSLAFDTGSGGSTSERMRIVSAGNISIGGSVISCSRLSVSSAGTD